MILQIDIFTILYHSLYTIFYCDRYDHETDEDFAEMSSKEDEVIAKYKLIKFNSDEN